MIEHDSGIINKGSEESAASPEHTKKWGCEQRSELEGKLDGMLDGYRALDLTDAKGFLRIRISSSSVKP